MDLVVTSLPVLPGTTLGDMKNEHLLTPLSLPQPLVATVQVLGLRGNRNSSGKEVNTLCIAKTSSPLEMWGP